MSIEEVFRPFNSIDVQTVSAISGLAASCIVLMTGYKSINISKITYFGKTRFSGYFLAENF